MVADFVMSIYRRDKIINRATYKIIKNRFGYDGHIFTSDVDYGKGILKIEKEETPEKIKGKTNQEIVQQGFMEKFKGDDYE